MSSKIIATKDEYLDQVKASVRVVRSVRRYSGLSSQDYRNAVGVLTSWVRRYREFGGKRNV